MAVKQTTGNRRVGDGTPGPGRPKGSQNKTTTAAKEAFQLAFVGIGGVPALIEWANDNREEFFKLYARLIPVDNTHSAPDGGPLRTTFVIQCPQPTKGDE